MLAVAAAPDTRPADLAPYVADDADPAALLAAIRALLAEVSGDDGRFVYEVVERVTAVEADRPWYVVGVVFGRDVAADAVPRPRTTEAAFGFVVGDGAFQLGRVLH